MHHRFVYACVAFVIFAVGCISNGAFPDVTSTIIVPPLRDYGQVGSLNHAFLQAEPYDTIVIEVDYVDGYAPNGHGTAAVANFLRAQTEKTVRFSGSDAIDPYRTTYTAQDFIDIERVHRDNYARGDTVVIYFLFLNGEFERESTLAASYTASSAAFFPDRMNEGTNVFITRGAIEESVVMHEFGHLLGLVNLNYESSRDHEDPDHPHHSKNRASVMYWAVEDVSISTIVRGGLPTAFDEDDLYDIAQLQAGRY